MKQLLSFVWLVCLASGHAADASASAQAGPSIASRFVTEISEGKHYHRHRMEWHFLRSPNRVERYDPKSGRGEAWEQGEGGKISYERIYHEDRRVVEYTPGDLNSVGRAFDWNQLSQLVAFDELARKLKRAGTRNIQGRTAERYVGTVGGMRIELLWLPVEKVPALLRQTSGNLTTVVRLKEIGPLESSPYRFASADYPHIDFADLGDKETDPFVKKIQGEVMPGHQHDH